MWRNRRPRARLVGMPPPWEAVCCSPQPETQTRHVIHSFYVQVSAQKNRTQGLKQTLVHPRSQQPQVGAARVSTGGGMVSKMGSIHTMRYSSIPAGKGGIQSPHLRCPHLPSLQGGTVNSTTSTQHWEPTGNHSGTQRHTELPLTGKHQYLGNFPRLIST